MLRYCFLVAPTLLLAWWSLIIGLLSLAIAYIYIPIYLARHTLLGAVWIYQTIHCYVLAYDHLLT